MSLGNMREKRQGILKKYVTEPHHYFRKVLTFKDTIGGDVMRRIIFITKRLALTLLLVSFLFSCAETYIKGSRIDEATVSKIEVGKTNKSYVLKMFGAPDRIIDTGAVATSKSAVAGDVNVASKQEVAVGKNQEIYIYEYWVKKSVPPVLSGYGGKTQESKNTLMIWIDKDTGIVQDYGYKKEIE